MATSSGRSLTFRSRAMALFLKPLIGFMTSTGVLTSVMVIVSYVG